MKKNVFILTVMLSSVAVSAQVAIGKETVSSPSALMEFDDNANVRGIILPTVEAAPTSLGIANNGTFLYDMSDRKLKMFVEGGWQDLSDEGDNQRIISNTTPEIGSGVIVGSETSSADGVLVLESSDKALVLPKIENPHTTVKSPYAGMMCYDTASKSLAVFDGVNWNYWK